MAVLKHIDRHAALGHQISPMQPTTPTRVVPAARIQPPVWQRSNMLIYKIFRRTEWMDLRKDGQTTGAPIDIQDGYIHFSTAAQVAETAAKYFATESDLVLLALDSTRLGADLKWEPSRGGALFPHLYRTLTLTDILWDKSLPLGATGHIFPEGVF